MRDFHMDGPDFLQAMIGRHVVIDVASQFVYLGKLVELDHKYLILVEADVHDLRDTSTNRENYVVDSRRFGIRKNRDRVLVKLGEVVSVSAMDDVIV